MIPKTSHDRFSLPPLTVFETTLPAYMCLMQTFTCHHRVILRCSERRRGYYRNRRMQHVFLPFDCTPCRNGTKGMQHSESKAKGSESGNIIRPRDLPVRRI